MDSLAVTCITVSDKPKRQAPRPASVLSHARAVIQERGFTNYSLGDIAAMRSHWWAVGAEKWPINLEGAIELGRRATFGNPQVPLKFRFTREIYAAFASVKGEKWNRWVCEDERTTADILGLIDDAAARLDTMPAQSASSHSAAARHKSAIAVCDPRLFELRMTRKSEVSGQLDISPGKREITLSGIVIGSLDARDVQEYIMGTPRTRKVYRAVLPNFLGQRVGKEGPAFAGVAEAVIIAVTGILKRHAQRNSEAEAA